MEEIESMKSKQ